MKNVFTGVKVNRKFIRKIQQSGNQKKYLNKKFISYTDSHMTFDPIKRKEAKEIAEVIYHHKNNLGCLSYFQ